MHPATSLVTHTVLLFVLYRHFGSSATNGDEDGAAAYVTYESRRLPNHSYVDASDISERTSIGCHSSLHTCCSAAQGPDRGDWYDPRGKPLQFSSLKGPHEARLPQRVEFRCSRKPCVDVSGLYRCEIAVRDSQRNRVRQKIYIGFYANGGGELETGFCKPFSHLL